MSKLLQWSLTAALAGFLFGFDTVVISGADQKLQELWGSSDGFHGIVVMAMALWGTVIGSLFGSIPTRILGRKKTLLWIGIFYSISALGSALATGPTYLGFFRFRWSWGRCINIQHQPISLKLHLQMIVAGCGAISPISF